MNLERHNARQRERYATDSAYKERVKAWSRAAYLKRKKNPEWVEKERIRNRERMRSYFSDPIKRKEIVARHLENAKAARRDPIKCEKLRARDRARHRKDLYKGMLSSSKLRAARRGTPYKLSRDIMPPIPTHCPVLGIPLFVGPGKSTDNSPTLDCIVPELGYIPGNVAIISKRANTIKSDATVSELRKIADWLERQL